jgi:metal-sulfur cluster biosynthetic enzyme
VTATTVGLESAAWRALGTVLDPELDQPITDLGFVATLEITGGEIRVDLRLPTYFCAPNFAYLMVADAHHALAALPEALPVRVRLLDHFASADINAGVAAAHGFANAFPGLANDELDDLRNTFLRKAHSAYQEQLASRLLRSGLTHHDLVQIRLRDLDDSPELTLLRQRRSQLGLPAGPDAPMLVDDDGHPLDEATLPLRLRLARTTRISIQTNASWCQGLLGTRYGSSDSLHSPEPDERIH